MKAILEIEMPKNCKDCEICYRDINLFCPILEKRIDEDNYGLCPEVGKREDCPIKI